MIMDKVKSMLPLFLKRIVRKIVFFANYISNQLEQFRRDRKSLFDVEALTKEMKLVSKEYGYNAFYGHDKVVKRMLRLPYNFKIYGAIEHGINFYNNIDPVEIEPDVIFTMSEKRRSFLRKHAPHKHIFAIGPYIQYADSLYSENEIHEIKKGVGRTLLIFPSHSSNDVKVRFDHMVFIEEIERIRRTHEYQTVLVCVYWRDYLDGMAKDYIDAGYLLCTAGHAFDKSFLRRLKSIILLADCVMVNKIGTNFGYAIACGKPVYLYKVCGTRTYVDSGKTVSDDSLEYRMDMEKEALPLFGNYSENINQSQIDFVKRYWGNW